MEDLLVRYVPWLAQNPAKGIFHRAETLVVIRQLTDFGFGPIASVSERPHSPDSAAELAAISILDPYLQ